MVGFLVTALMLGYVDGGRGQERARERVRERDREKWREGGTERERERERERGRERSCFFLTYKDTNIIIEAPPS
jgi:hypothetical protein